MKRIKNIYVKGQPPCLDDSLFFSKTTDFFQTVIPKQSNGSENTIKSYKTGLSMFREYVRDQKGISIRKFKFSDCTYDLFLDYRNWLHDSKGYMESTTNNRLAAIRSYMNYVSARDISLQQIAFCVSEVPAYRVPKKIGPVIDQLETLTALLSAPPNTRTGLRDKTILSVLFDTAIRVDELVRLDFSDVNLYVFDPYIHVHGKGNKERKVYFSENTLDLIKQYIKEFHYEKNRNDPFFYSKIRGERGYMSRRNIERIVKKYADQIRPQYPDLPSSVYPHLLRRTRATGLYQDGVEIEAISTFLGHSLLQTTKDHYVRPSIDQLRNAIEKKDDDKEIEEPLWLDDEELAKLCGLR